LRPFFLGQNGGVPPLQRAHCFPSCAIDAPSIDKTGGDFNANSLQHTKPKFIEGCDQYLKKSLSPISKL
jgi:hypothetical protein